MRESRHKILSLLGEGKENARSAAELARILNVEERKIRIMVNRARNDGELICSGMPGYWLPGDPAELRETYRRMRGEALSILKALRHTRQKIEETGAAEDE